MCEGSSRKEMSWLVFYWVPGVKFFFWIWNGSQNYSWLQVLGLLDVICLVPNNLFFHLYIKERIFVGGRDWVDSGLVRLLKKRLMLMLICCERKTLLFR